MSTLTVLIYSNFSLKEQEKPVVVEEKKKMLMLTFPIQCASTKMVRPVFWTFFSLGTKFTYQLNKRLFRI